MSDRTGLSVATDVVTKTFSVQTGRNAIWVLATLDRGIKSR